MPPARFCIAIADARVIVLSIYSDEEFIVRGSRRESKAISLKDAVQADLVQAIRAVTKGRSSFSPDIARRLAEDYFHPLQSKGLEDS